MKAVLITAIICASLVAIVYLQNKGGGSNE